MRQFNEDLKANDLYNLVDNIFEIDTYGSKMGSDQDIVVLSFTVEDKEPADDLVNFIERGYDFVLDADATPGELSNGAYKVFVEIERNHRVAEQILEMLDGVGKLTGINSFKFRYYKNFESIPADVTNLTETIPTSKDDYQIRIKESTLNNFSNFFNKSYIESISVDSDDLVFQKKYAEPLRMRIKQFGTTQTVYESLKGPLLIEGQDLAQVLFLSKFLGDYNINKIGNTFIFENTGYAVAMERV
jgi:hypothetical protein